MNRHENKRPAKRNWMVTLAIILMATGVLAFAVPLIWQRIDYGIAARKAAETEAQIVIPDEGKYKPVDYTAMEKGVTPTFSPGEMEEAATPPSLLEELGIIGQPASRFFGIASARAEAAEPSSMRQALERGAQALEAAAQAPYDGEKVMAALAAARKEVENAFFLLTQIQPITDTEILSSFSSQQAVDGISRGDKIITAVREMVYATLIDLEALLKQVEDQASAAASREGNQAAESLVLAQVDTLSSYLAMAAIHLPQDDYQSAMERHRELARQAGLLPEAAENESGYAAIDVDEKGVKRLYLLEIPDINLKVSTYRSGSFNKMYQNMRVGGAMFPRAPEPDTVANICISAHRTGTRDYFRNLDKLSPGDVIYLHTSHLGSFKYEVVKVAVIEANDWSVTRDAGYPALTLLSCQAFGGISNAQRIMVRAKLVAAADGQE